MISMFERYGIAETLFLLVLGICVLVFCSLAVRAAIEGNVAGFAIVTVNTLFGVRAFAGTYHILVSRWERKLANHEFIADLERLGKERDEMNKKHLAAIDEIVKQIVPAAQPKPVAVPATKPSRSKSGYVYVIREKNGSHYKIGKTGNPKDRMKTFEVKLPFQVEYEALIQTEDMHSLEKKLHRKFASKRVNGEWFSLDDADLEYLKSLAQQ